MKKTILGLCVATFFASGCVVARPLPVRVGPKAKRCKWVKRPGKTVKRVCVHRNRYGTLVRTR